ncbi:MAG: extracellular solute-binding protein [Oscillospiraceae bacterium]|nr:extracellular solute-binding protein [Oscillospiraceae bacterium]MBO7727476.1 extracellular solute-binding protein [Oscillospiraceae bacterium]
MILALVICGSASASAAGKVSITIFNSKNEIQEHLEEAAEEYGKANGVDIEVYYSQDTVSAHLSTRYAAKDPYTINMVDAKDVYSLGAIYGYDMTGEDWVSDTDYAISVDGKVVGFPVCVEARGILYNADAIETTLGEEFDPESIKTLDDFKAFLDRMVAGGMELPTAILKPDWSLAAHYLQHVYEEHTDVDAFIQDLYDGKVDLMQDAKFNALMDTFDVLKEYNYFKAAPISAEDALVHQVLSEGVDAFQFGGCWEWNDIIDYDYTGNIGLMPIPQNLEDEFTGKMVVFGSKYFYVDNSESTTDEQRAVAVDFLNWFALSDEAKTLVSDTCAMISPFKSNDVPCANDIGVSVKKYADAGLTISSYDYDPDDHYSKLGMEMQRYLADQCTREQLAEAIQNYWANVTPVQH